MLMVAALELWNFPQTKKQPIRKGTSIKKYSNLDVAYSMTFCISISLDKEHNICTFKL